MGRYNTQDLKTFSILSALSYRSSVSVSSQVPQSNYHVIAKQYDSSTGFGAQASFTQAACGYAESARSHLDKGMIDR